MEGRGPTTENKTRFLNRICVWAINEVGMDESVRITTIFNILHYIFNETQKILLRLPLERERERE